MIPDTAAELERVQKLVDELQSSADQEEWHFHNGVCEEEYHADLRKYAAALGEWGRLREALEWYGEQARLCRLIHSEGDAGRHALSADGGKRAAAALAPAPEAQA